MTERRAEEARKRLESVLAMLAYVSGQACLPGSQAGPACLGLWPSLLAWVSGQACLLGSLARLACLDLRLDLLAWVSGQACSCGLLCTYCRKLRASKYQPAEWETQEHWDQVTAWFPWKAHPPNHALHAANGIRASPS